MEVILYEFPPVKGSTKREKKKKENLEAVWPDLAKFRHFGKMTQIFKWLRDYLAKFGPTLAKLLCFWTAFQCCKWPNIEKQSSHLVTLLESWIVRSRRRKRIQSLSTRSISGKSQTTNGRTQVQFRNSRRLIVPKVSTGGSGGDSSGFRSLFYQRCCCDPSKFLFICESVKLSCLFCWPLMPSLVRVYLVWIQSITSRSSAVLGVGVLKSVWPVVLVSFTLLLPICRLQIFSNKGSFRRTA